MYRDTEAPWIKWDPTVFLTDIRGMNLAESGLYSTFCQFFWLNGNKPLKQDRMIFLMGTMQSNEKRLEKFKKKYPIYFNEKGEFFTKSLDDALAHAIKRSKKSENGNKAKKEKKEKRIALEALKNVDFQNHDGSHKDIELDDNINKQLDSTDITDTSNIIDTSEESDLERLKRFEKEAEIERQNNPAFAKPSTTNKTKK